MIYRVSHTTVYTYTATVSVCHNDLHLRPRDSAFQNCMEHHLLVQPQPAVISRSTDFFGNQATFLAIQEPHRMLTVTAHSTVEVRPVTLPAPEATPPWEQVRDNLRYDHSAAGLEAYQYVFDSPCIACSTPLRRYATPAFTPGRSLLHALQDFTQRIYDDFTYDTSATSISTPLKTVLRHRRGVCQDFAHLQIGCLRSLGLAARYVSGYLVTQPPPGQSRLVGADASHAWVSVYCPGIGWIDADPTNNVLPSDKHITVALGRDYSDVSPIKGVFLGGGQHTMAVAVDVVPVVL
jgi:transglutaminase-like putative cysteine protease